MKTNTSKNRSTTSNKSVISYLKSKNVVNDELLVLINNLTLEDLIALKLELSSRMLNNRLYGFDIWHRSNYIIKEAILKFAISATKSKKDAARFLGLNYLEFKRVVAKYKVKKYFTEDI